MKTIVYSKPNCPGCVKLKSELKAEGVEFVEQILATGTGYFDILLGCRGLPRNEEITQSAYTELPTGWVFEVGNTDPVFGELGAEAKVAAVELRPLAKHLGKLFGNDVVGVLTHGSFAQPSFDVHQFIQRCVEVNIRRHRHIQIPLGFTEVQVGPVALARRIQDTLIVWGCAIKHSVSASAIA